MGFSADDTRIRDSFAIATDRGLGYSFTPNEVETDIHPNTVDIRMENAAGQVMTVRGESLGGGKVRIVRINGVEVDFTGGAPSSVRAMAPIRAAPAVWELEGPIMFGPRTSKTLINAMGCHSCQVKNRAPRIRRLRCSC